MRALLATAPAVFGCAVAIYLVATLAAVLEVLR